MKKAILLVLSLVLIVCSFSSCKSTREESTADNKTMIQYTYENLTFSKPEDENYKCSVENNKGKYITVDANNEGEYYWLTVTTNKPTYKNKKPIITVYKESDGKKTIIKEFRITVNPASEVKMSDIKLNHKTGKRVTLKNPYYECKEYNLKYNKKILNITQYLYDGDKAIYTFKGLKKGKTTVKAYLTGTKKLIGSFTVTVGDYEAYIKKNRKNITIYYNSHMTDSTWLNKGSFDLGKAIGNYHADSAYSVTTTDSELIGTTKNSSDEITPSADLIYSKKAGTTELTVYEKRGKSDKRKIGTINLTVKNAKNSEVYNSNRERDNDGIFYEFVISPGDTVDLKEIVKKRYLNTEYSHFDDDEYTFTAKSSYTNTVTVDNNGICTCHDYGSNYVSYTITFKDGSKITEGGSFDIIDED